MRFNQSLALKQVCICKLRKVGIGRSLLAFFTPSTSPASADYAAWRHGFLWDRLGLCLWLFFAILLTFVLRDFYSTVFPLKELQNVPDPLKQLTVPIYIIVGVLLVGWLVVHRTRFGRQHPEVLFLGLSWSLTIAPQILASLSGFPLPDILGWMLVFFIQATLIPVRWELHLLSQLVLLFYFYGVNSALGLTVFSIKPGHPDASIFMLTIFMYLVWVCLICDLAVFLYERLQRAEFESRRQAQVFLNAVSHDLRNPVTGTLMVLRNLLKKPDDTIAVPRSLLERMVDSSDRQLVLINSLLDVGTTNLRELKLHPQSLCLNTLVNSALADLEPLLQENQAMLINQIPPDLPSVNADETQIWRVLSNLIANALNHNPPGISLTLSATSDISMVQCCVQDDGVGMSRGECDRVFDLYNRGSQARRSSGLGLGLYLCRKIIVAHGGKIGVSSSPGKGATFWFTLPRAD
ncbi:HAMP domain-containing histidine kinase [Kovacikia minuta CCNUW1]|uniref:sensor histidine kinase n=1 Tax=Kovacikia minuta TaxID=2931930 RepID=UPI001CCE7691|nr:HAMP domain-containing sensor histidine kinase [Kovacikia minuta]UBF26583.1 HAMP domain-containing histidine kinase [Kovacikia minuta CCNUW1]